MDKQLRELESMKAKLASDLETLRGLAPDAKTKEELIRIRESLISTERADKLPDAPIERFGEAGAFGTKDRSPRVPNWLAALVICSFVAVLLYAAFKIS